MKYAKTYNTRVAVIVLLIKVFVWWSSLCRCRRGLLKVPYIISYSECYRLQSLSSKLDWKQNHIFKMIVVRVLQNTQCFSHDIAMFSGVPNNHPCGSLTLFLRKHFIFISRLIYMAAGHSYGILSIVENVFHSFLRAASQLTDKTLIWSPQNTRDVFNCIFF